MTAPTTYLYMCKLFSALPHSELSQKFLLDELGTILKHPNDRVVIDCNLTCLSSWRNKRACKNELSE